MFPYWVQAGGAAAHRCVEGMVGDGIIRRRRALEVMSLANGSNVCHALNRLRTLRSRESAGGIPGANEEDCQAGFDTGYEGGRGGPTGYEGAVV